MPAGNFILQAWDEQQKNFCLQLQHLRQKPGKKAVHDVRVAVKKLRSFLKLSERITGEGWKDLFKTTKILFGTIGKYRDIEMSISLLSRFSREENLPCPGFRKYLKTILSLARGRIKNELTAYDEKDMENIAAGIHVSFSVFSNEELNSRIKDAVEEKFRKINELCRDFKKNAHEIRKLLKDVYYWLRSTPDKPLLAPSELNELEKILRSLGSWHDHFVFLKKLHYYGKECLVKGTDEFVIIRQLEESVTRKKDETGELANAGVEKFLKLILK